MNYFELYPGDYLRDTAELTLAEHGAFLLLLSAYYATERAIPSDNPTLFRLVRAMTIDEQNAVTRVSELFFPISAVDGLRHNKRADEEIVKARARIDAARENGRLGGRPKKPSNNPVGSNPLTQQEPNGGPSNKAPHAPDPMLHKEQEQRAGALPTKSRGTRLPIDWSPSPDLLAWATTERPDIPLSVEIDKFRDHWKSAAGAKGVKLDWSATFRNWVRNANAGKTNANLQSSRKLSVVEQIETNIRDRREREGDCGDAALVLLGHG